MYFDIGANIGNWSLENISKCDKIIAVEASSITYEKLLENCKNDNIKLINYAICNNKNKEITLYHTTNNNNLSSINKNWLTSSHSRYYNEPYETIICKTLTLDDLISLYDIPELIKINVNAGEYECISSLTKKVDLLCFYWTAETINITLKCIEHLISIGFTKFHIQINNLYVYKPNDYDYNNLDMIEQILLTKILKKDYGMIWCK
jgi:FkbM family methyltransferase